MEPETQAFHITDHSVCLVTTNLTGYSQLRAIEHVHQTDIYTNPVIAEVSRSHTCNSCAVAGKTFHQP